MKSWAELFLDFKNGEHVIFRCKQCHSLIGQVWGRKDLEVLPDACPACGIEVLDE